MIGAMATRGCTWLDLPLATPEPGMEFRQRGGGGVLLLCLQGGNAVEFGVGSG